MVVPPLRALIVLLGRELVARGRVETAETMRVYLLALDRGLVDKRQALNVNVTPELVHRWLGVLQIPPFESMFPVIHGPVTGCPKCNQHGGFTEMSVLDRSLTCCAKCKHRWLAIHAA